MCFVLFPIILFLLVPDVFPDEKPLLDEPLLNGPLLDEPFTLLSVEVLPLFPKLNSLFSTPLLLLFELKFISAFLLSKSASIFDVLSIPELVPFIGSNPFKVSSLALSGLVLATLSSFMFLPTPEAFTFPSNCSEEEAPFDASALTLSL